MHTLNKCPRAGRCEREIERILGSWRVATCVLKHILPLLHPLLALPTPAPLLSFPPRHYHFHLHFFNFLISYTLPSICPLRFVDETKYLAIILTIRSGFTSHSVLSRYERCRIPFIPSSRDSIGVQKNVSLNFISQIISILSN